MRKSCSNCANGQHNGKNIVCSECAYSCGITYEVDPDGRCDNWKGRMLGLLRKRGAERKER